MDQNESVIMRSRLRQLHATFTLAACSELKPGGRTEQPLLHEQHCLMLPLSGRCEIQLDHGEKHTAQPGELYFIPQGVTMNCTVADEENFRFYWICFHLDAGTSEFIRLLNLPLFSCIANPQRVEQLFHQLVELKGQLTLADELRARAIVMELVAFFLEGGLMDHAEWFNDPELQALSGVLNYIDEHLADNPTVEELARQIYLHPNYFITYFRSLTGLTPIQYVNQRKIEHARELLDSGDTPVQEAARAVGLNNPYFSRLFKQQVGMAPRRYRQLMASKKEQRVQQPASVGIESTRWMEEFGWMEDALPTHSNAAYRMRGMACTPHGG
ncbi:AraC-type DNA-binding protein [Paenibacillaceae bacterium GAS479]|nr:AraC-type DNA-binding protein [Paenibacillaceae bacterium GAS479]